MSQPSKPTVLVVDDEIDICRNLADILGDLDYEVDTACSGKAALELAHNKRFDVALLDLKMPGMDGVTLYRRLRKVCPSTVAVIVTAYASDPTTHEALSAGAAQVLSKPVDLSMLLSIVRDAVGQPLVLVVDDDESLCESLWDLLRERNLRVGMVHTERAAVEALADQNFQVVLVDLRLPGGDGRTVLDVLQRSYPESRTVLITGHAVEFDDVVAHARNYGADAVCCKPFDVRTLLATVERLARQTGSRA